MQKLLCSSWGNYPRVRGEFYPFYQDLDRLKFMIQKERGLIPYGNGRSYGDSALSDKMLYIKPHNYFLDFESKTGLLHIQSGVLLGEILDIFVPQGWFLKISPGTKWVTVGGAIASDIHGKNHHLKGCFSECVESLRLLLPSGEVVALSKKKNTELFRATCGGMGLTGVILDAKIYLKRIASANILQTTIKTKNLRETFDAFEQYQNTSYSVAWIDCFAKKNSLGRSLLMLGDFDKEGGLSYKTKSKTNIPFYFPSFVLNKTSMSLFNRLYYSKTQQKRSLQRVSIDTFFYPLDAINNWNRIYGKSGFTQYQFILPKASSFEGLTLILQKIVDASKGSFLAVLKLYSQENSNYLSFPLKGYSLALDFKIEKNLFALLDKLDDIVIAYGGRVYLSKDARISKKNFEMGYAQINKFRELRVKYAMDKKFYSIQSQRLKI